MKRRGLVHPELIDTFKFGYANRTLGYRLQGGDIRARLQSLGVLRASGHEHLSGSLVIPIVDGQGNVVQMYGRKLLDNLRARESLRCRLPLLHSCPMPIQQSTQRGGMSAEISSNFKQ